MSCNCAVSVLSGDDVIVIDRCGPSASPTKKVPLTVKLYKKGELTPGTRIRRIDGGLKYKVCREHCTTCGAWFHY